MNPIEPAPFVLAKETFEQGLNELSERDPQLGQAIERWGPPPFWTHAAGFPGLVLAILSQQVSLESAEHAFTRLGERIEPIDAAGFLSLDERSLREIGFSRQKAGYVRGLARSILDGELDLDWLESMADETARQRLLKIKGVGRWTADTYLLFALRRADAWPSGDLALVIAIQEVHGLPARPSYEEADRIAERWSPWRAVAARILWHHYLNQRGRG